VNVNPGHQQLPFTIRMDWGSDGAAAIGAEATVAVVVDVLSFTTTVSVALDSGITVLPFRWDQAGASAYAAQHDAVLAVGRSNARPGQVTLSPQSVRAAQGISRLVLPSPNGSAISAELMGRGARVVAASLRNAQAVANWISGYHGADGAHIAVVAAGERWPGGGLRPAVEDLWGAGAVIASLLRAGWWQLSPEAMMAADAFRAVETSLPARLHACPSGAELDAAGFGGDVDIAAERNTSDSVPVLGQNGFYSNVE
jgi:2-phosphosulfolactate phosphatase